MLCNEDNIVMIKTLTSSTGPEKTNNPSQVWLAVGCLFSRQVG